MSLSGTRGLIRISINPSCEAQAAMAAERVNEVDLYRRLTAQKYPREYGERVAARRRGYKFEVNLHKNDAALLRRAVGPLYGHDPEAMTVRNLADEIPGPPTTMRALRLQRTRRVLQDLAAGNPVPDLIIQPQLTIPTGPGSTDFEFVSPDFMILDTSRKTYVPGEEKSFIVREPGDAGRVDKDRTRRQAAAEVIALRSEMVRLGLADRVTNRAVFVFATPFGLRPAPPKEDHLDAEVEEIIRAISCLISIRRKLQGMRAPSPVPLEDLIDELPINYQEGCISSCVLADRCRRRAATAPSVLGDAAAVLLSGVDLGRAMALLCGAEPASSVESDLAALLRDGVSILPVVERRTA